MIRDCCSMRTHGVQAEKAVVEKAEAEKIKKAEAEKANALKMAVRHASGSHGTKGAAERSTCNALRIETRGQ